MEHYKNAKVVLLPTKECHLKGILMKVPYYDGEESKPKLEINSSATNIFKHSKSYIPQHLHVISDNEKKEGDWCINENNNIFQYIGGLLLPTDKKIIATTNTSLSQTKADDARPMIFIPQPSQQFIKYYIEEYNKGNIITDVLVEYEPQSYSNRFEDGKSIGDSETWGKRLSLKVNPKDNTITIKQIKDSWNREEVEPIIDFIREIAEDSLDRVSGGVRSEAIEKLKWIEKNL